MAEAEAAIPQIGSLVKDTALDGEKVRVDEILNKEIVVCGFKITASKFKDKGCGYCSKVQFYFVDDANKTRKVFFSGSGVVKEQLEEAKAALDKTESPLLFKATVKKVGNYYSFV